MQKPEAESAAPLPRGVPADWLQPEWPAPAHVHALCTTRAGGVSAAPFNSLNLGDHVHDDPAAVRANRTVLGQALAARGTPARPVFLRQVHGTGVHALERGTPDGTEADACTASAPGVACTIMVADCLPVLFTDVRGTLVAAAHAGWRGLAGQNGHGVLEAVLECFRAPGPCHPSQNATKIIAQSHEFVVQAHDVMAWLGPCIGPAAFEVGPEVRSAFCDHDPAAQAHFTAVPGGKFLADLAGLARQRLQALGVRSIHGNDGSPAWCTVSQPSRFFSHRRDTATLGGSGRFAACVWLDRQG